MELDERNIGGGHKKMRLTEFIRDCMDAVVKVIDWLDNKGGEDRMY